MRAMSWRCATRGPWNFPSRPGWIGSIVNNNSSESSHCNNKDKHYHNHNSNIKSNRSPYNAPRSPSPKKDNHDTAW